MKEQDLGDSPRSAAPSHRLALYATGTHECPYLDNRVARTAFVDPDAPMSGGIYGNLLQQGFRRSGPYVYRPACPGCGACQSLRIPVEAFRPTRGQRRCWRRNSDLVVTTHEPRLSEDEFQLYRRYIGARHAGGSMDNPDRDSYLHFLAAEWADTLFHAFFLDGQLAAVAVSDRLADSLSAVYTFFDPDLARRSLGTYAILWQIEEARRLGFDYLHLGYWVAGSQKMAYKADFTPHEIRVGSHWLRVEDRDRGPALPASDASHARRGPF